MNENPQILVIFYDYLLYLVQRVSKFPRNQRYLMGERLEMLSLEVMARLVAAAFSTEKLEILKDANIKLEQIRFHVRLCKDTKLLNLQHYEVMSKKLNDIGIQLGAWIKHQSKKA